MKSPQSTSIIRVLFRIRFQNLNVMFPLNTCKIPITASGLNSSSIATVVERTSVAFWEQGWLSRYRRMCHKTTLPCTVLYAWKQMRSCLMSSRARLVSAEKEKDFTFCKGDLKAEQVGFTRSEPHFIFECSPLQLELDYDKNLLCHQSIFMTYKLPQV